ncbi:MAG: metal ABC transporter permease [Opitutaceae bacterium]|nr:metal ABC transporter permease [Opitutaceae bacterium]
MNDFIPSFDFYTVFVEPWTVDADTNIWLLLMGFLVTTACGLIGKFIILRRLALVGDAISHSLLPGIAVAFILTSSRATFPMFIGAVIAGVVTTVLIEFIHRKSRVKPDAAIGIVFSTLFAIGVIIITVFADHVDLDADCVLYGEIAFVPFLDPVELGGMMLGPFPVVRMAIVLLILIGLILLFYKELLVTSFDPALAASLGIRNGVFHYGLMIVLSLVIVSSFESVGAILVIAMLIFPGATGSLLSDRLPVILWMVAGLSFLYALLGIHLAIWLNCSIAGAMVVIALLLFIFVWVFSPKKGLLQKWVRQRLEDPDSPSSTA